MTTAQMSEKKRRPAPPWWLQEKRLPISQPAKLGLSVSEQTVWRWCEHGCRRRRTSVMVKLESMYEGSQRYTSIERVNAFLAKLNGVE